MSKRTGNSIIDCDYSGDNEETKTCPDCNGFGCSGCEGTGKLKIQPGDYDTEDLDRG
jgi:hypothetical protein